MVSETWQCFKCKREISFQVKGTTWKNSPIGKNCECGGLWEFKKRVTKRKSMEIWRDIHSLLKLDFDKYEERIRYANLTQENLLKLENAIKKFVKGENHDE